MRHRRLHTLALAALIGAAAVLHAQASTMIGNATSVVKEVRGKTDAELRVLVVNDDVFHNEEISTATYSATKLLFKDNTTLTMGENSRMKLTKVVFDPDPSKSAVAAKATQGVFRMSTGRLPSSAYRIDTPVATIGVRGTVIEFTVGPDGATTLYVASGTAFVTVDRPAGPERVTVPMGQATTVTLGNDGLPTAPSPPGPPSSAFVEQVRHMTMLVQMSGALGDIQPGAGGLGSAAALNVNLALSNSIGIGPSSTRAPGAPGLGLGGVDLIRSTPRATTPVVPTPQTLTSSTPTQTQQQQQQQSQQPQQQSNQGTTTVNGPTATIPGPPTVTLDATPPERVRIGARTDIGVNVSSSGGAATGTLGAGAGGVSGSGGGITVPNGASTVVTYVFLATEHGPQSGSIPFAFDNPSGGGTLLIDTIGVGPDLRTDLPVIGVDFLEVPVGQSQSLYFRLGNLTADEGTLDLTGLTILGLEIIGRDAQYYSVEVDPDGHALRDGHVVLGPGEILELVLTFHAPDIAGLYDQAMLRLITDQFAAFGEPGLEIQVGLRAMAIAEPVGLGLIGLAAMLGWMTARRRR